MLHLVLAIFKEFSIIPDKWMFHKALNSFKFDCEIMLDSLPRTNQYEAMRVKFI